MEVVSGAVVLAWLAIILIALAVVGLIQQVRDLSNAITTQRATGGQPFGNNAALDAVLPGLPRLYSTILLVDKNCPTCHKLAPSFAASATNGPEEVRWIVLARNANEGYVLDVEGKGAEVITDNSAFSILDPGWRPAVVVIDGKGNRLTAEPVGNHESLSQVLDHIKRVAVESR